MSRKQWLICLVVLGGCQCGTGTSPGDGGSSPGPDAGWQDAGASDAGRQDGGSPDSGTRDGGLVDAGTWDAGASDAGASDAGGSDAGGSDAGPFDGGDTCSTPCSNWTDCTAPGEGCDVGVGCCVPCGATGAPCCVDFTQGHFSCNSTSDVCGISIGGGTAESYYCCHNAGDGCCEQGGCVGGTCCKCPPNGLNACVDPAFGCGGC